MTDTRKADLMKIGGAAKRLKVSANTIRIYHSAGLILPVTRRSGHRFFDKSDLERLRCIRKTISKKKISISGIKRLLALIPCWQIKGCSQEDRESCPAYEDFEHPCWHHKAQYGRVAPICETEECRTCAVYNSVQSCDGLKQLLKKFVGPGMQAGRVTA